MKKNYKRKKFTKQLINNLNELSVKGLCDIHIGKDACGVGVVANIKGVKSNKIIKDSLKVLNNLSHRGACGCDPDTGDGAGITLQIPDKFFRNILNENKLSLPDLGQYASGIIFLPNEKKLREKIINIIEKILLKNNLSLISWRDVPVDQSKIGLWASDVKPEIKQIFISTDKNITDDEFSKILFIARKMIEKEVLSIKDNSNSTDINNEFYICSLSNKIIIYKGLLKSEQLANFYVDLQNSNIESCFGLVHSRFSTNTLGSWKLAHPYRMIAHNGEINTVRGNRNWIKAKEQNLQNKHLGSNIQNILPICEEDASDTAS